MTAAQRLDHIGRVSHDVGRGELDDGIAAVLQIVSTTRILATVGVGGVPNPPRHLDHYSLTLVEKVDSDSPRRTSLERDLRQWPGETSAADDAEKPTLERRLAARIEEQLTQ